jgi:hypothetical protein
VQKYTLKPGPEGTALSREEESQMFPKVDHEEEKAERAETL